MEFPIGAIGSGDVAMNSAEGLLKHKAELNKHAAEFESLLMTQLLEKLERAYKIPGAEEEDSAGETVHGLGLQSLGRALANRGGVGIGKLIASSLAGPQENAPR